MDTCSILVVLTRQSNPPISQFNIQCNEFMSVWSKSVYNISSNNVKQTPAGDLDIKVFSVIYKYRKKHFLTEYLPSS